jgi:hypothetical protein
MCVAGWQVFKQLVLEGRSGTNLQVSSATDTAAAAQAAGDTSSSHSGSKPPEDADAGPGSSSQVQALQDQLRKLRLQVGWPTTPADPQQFHPCITCMLAVPSRIRMHLKLLGYHSPHLLRPVQLL